MIRYQAPKDAQIEGKTRLHAWRYPHWLTLAPPSWLGVAEICRAIHAPSALFHAPFLPSTSRPNTPQHGGSRCAALLHRSRWPRHGQRRLPLWQLQMQLSRPVGRSPTVTAAAARSSALDLRWSSAWAPLWICAGLPEARPLLLH